VSVAERPSRLRWTLSQATVRHSGASLAVSFKVATAVVLETQFDSQAKLAVFLAGYCGVIN